MQQSNNWIYLKDLTIALTLKELKSKYKSTTLGFLWILVNPLLQMVVLTIVFSLFLKMDIKNYPLFVFSGLLPWTYFSLSLQSGTSSLINNRELLRKVPFPREILPLSSVLAHLLTFLLALSLLIVYIVLFSNASASILLVVPLILLQTLLSFALVLFLSSLDIYYRDVSFILQSALLVWFYITPIFYPIKLVPNAYIFLYNINPMSGITLSYQSLFLQNPLPYPNALVVSVIETIVLFLIGFYTFRKRSKYFADWV